MLYLLNEFDCKFALAGHCPGPSLSSLKLTIDGFRSFQAILPKISANTLSFFLLIL